MSIEFTCLYCNFTWDKTVYSDIRKNAQICPKCKSQTLKIRQKDLNKKIDYYSDKIEKEDE